MLGVAGGTVARAYAKYFPDTVIDAVEIDGELFDIGRRWFGLEDRPQLRVHADDARPFLRKTDERYDFIFLDTYRQPYIPFYLATKEFFELARDRLAPGGAVIINVGPSGGLRAARAGAHRDDGRRVPATSTRDAVTRHEHAADGQRRRAVARPPAGGGAQRCRPSCAPSRSRTRGRLGAAAARRRRLHRRQGAGGVARRQVADRLRRRGMSELPAGLRAAPLAPDGRGGGDRGSGARARSTTTARRCTARTTSSRSSSGPASTSAATPSAVRDGGALVAFGDPATGARHAFVHVLPEHRGRGIGDVAAAAGPQTRPRGRPATSRPARRLRATSTRPRAAARPTATSARWESWTFEIALDARAGAAGRCRTATRSARSRPAGTTAPCTA